MTRELYYERKTFALCVTCGEPLNTDDGVRCGPCKNKIKALRDRRASEQKCSECGGLLVESVSRTCSPCKARSRTKTRKCVNNYRVQGLCLRCGTNTDGDHSRCVSCRSRKRETQRQLEAANPEVRLRKNLRCRLNVAIKNSSKSGSAVHDLGCSIPEFKQYIESRFQPGMSWDNYGKTPTSWSFDHVKPLSRFDLSDREQFLQANHYTNIQPLWHVENCSKGGRCGE